MLSDFLLRAGGQNANNTGKPMEETGINSQGLQNRKAVAGFLLMMLLACCAFVGVMVMIGGFIPRIVHAIGFICLGLLHIQTMNNRGDLLHGRQKTLYTAALLIAQLIILSIGHLIFPAYSWMQVFAAISGFALPYTLNKLWQFYQALSVGEGKPWVFSSELPLQKATTFLNSMPIKFKVQLEEGGELQYQVSFRAPVRMPLGLIFYHMVQSQQGNGSLPIHLVDSTDQPYRWVFSTTRLGFAKNLDPDAGLIENGVRENNVVLAKRLAD